VRSGFGSEAGCLTHLAQKVHASSSDTATDGSHWASADLRRLGITETKFLGEHKCQPTVILEPIDQVAKVQ
jgi:hypothetical protein